MEHETRLRQAAEWQTRLNASDVDEDATAEWLEWCQQDPENIAEFERMRLVWDRFDDPRLAAPLRNETPVRKARFAFPRAHFTRVAAAAALLLAVGASVLWLYKHAGGTPGFTDELRTAVAVVRSETLPDGSRVDLGAHSTVRIRFTRERRTVFIDAGEAFFQVAKDSERPFVVRSGVIEVVALGTAFNVRRTATRVIVNVEEGVVRVASVNAHEDVRNEATEAGEGQVRAGPGLQVTYAAEQRSLTVAKVQPAATAAWRTGRLEFIAEPLTSVVADLNRYSPRPIEVNGERLGTLIYTGTVRSDAIEDWLNAIEAVFPVAVIDHGAAGIELRDRVPP